MSPGSSSNPSFSQKGARSKGKLPQHPRLTDEQLNQLIDEIPKPKLTKCQAQLHRLGGNVSVEVEEQPFKYIVPEEDISSDDEDDKWGETYIHHSHPRREAQPPVPTKKSGPKFRRGRVQPMGRTDDFVSTASQSRTSLFESPGTGRSSLTSLTGSGLFQMRRSSHAAEKAGAPAVKGKEKGENSSQDCSRGVISFKSPFGSVGGNWMRK